MTEIFYESDADPAALDGQTVAVVGYGNQGRSWALNLRDTGLDVQVCARADESRSQAEADGFTAGDIASASSADVICILVPDDVIADLPLEPKGDTLVIVASGYAPAFGRFEPDCDIAMIAPRMLGPEVRSCYEEGIGFISAVGVHADKTGTALARTLAVAHALGALRQGAIELTPRQEAILDLAEEQVLTPALRKVNLAFTQVMAEKGIPMEAIICELFFSGEVERAFRRLRREGYANQLEHHSPTSQYGQLSRADVFDDVDLLPTMREIVEDIDSGRFADEWDGERANDYATLAELKELYAGPAMKNFEADFRTRLGEGVLER